MKTKLRFAIGVVVVGAAVAAAGLRRFASKHDARASSGALASAEAPSRSAVPRGSSITPNARSVIEAVQNRNHPERLSALIAPTPFDGQAWARDPQAYLDVVEPGRCFRTATRITPATPRLTAGEVRLLRATRGTAVPLLVQGAPNAPVTFTAFSGGSFIENGLNSIGCSSHPDGSSARAA